ARHSARPCPTLPPSRSAPCNTLTSGRRESISGSSSVTSRSSSPLLAAPAEQPASGCSPSPSPHRMQRRTRRRWCAEGKGIRGTWVAAAGGREKQCFRKPFPPFREEYRRRTAANRRRHDHKRKKRQSHCSGLGHLPRNPVR